MTPIEARHTLNGDEIEKITAEDGVEIAFETPVGLTRAKLTPKKGMFSGMLGERFATQFPGERVYRDYFSIFQIIAVAKASMMKEVTRSKTYSTNKGEVVIELKAIDSDTPNGEITIKNKYE